jgi:hypothetical protein
MTSDDKNVELRQHLDNNAFLRFFKLPEEKKVVAEGAITGKCRSD